MVAQDYFTKWPEVKAVPQKSAKLVVEFIEEYTYSRFGCPIELITDQGREFLGEVNRLLTRGLVIHRTTSAYRPQANGLVDHLNGVTARATLSKGDVRTWEQGLLDFLTGYRGLRHSSTGKSPHQLLMLRPMRMPWKFHAMPRPVIPDDLSGAVVEKHMVCLGESLKILHGAAREEMLKRQIRNMREYNLRKAVNKQGQVTEFFVGDLVWVKNVNPRRNKLQQLYFGPYYIRKLLGEPTTAAELSMDGENFVTRSIEHLCLYHVNSRLETGGAESSKSAEERLMLNRGVCPKVPFSWSEAVAPEARSQLERLAGEERERRSAERSCPVGPVLGRHPSDGHSALSMELPSISSKEGPDLRMRSGGSDSCGKAPMDSSS